MKPEKKILLRCVKTLLFVWTAFMMSSGLVCAREGNTEWGSKSRDNLDSPTPGIETSAGGWNFTIAFPMIWAVSISGEINGGGDRVDIEIPFGDILEDLSFGILGEVYAYKGPWSFALKVNYLDTEDESVTEALSTSIWGIPIPVAPQHRIKTNLRMGANDLLVRYQVHDKFLLSTGVRHLHTKLDMEITALGTGLIAINEQFNVADDHLFDWLVGASFIHWFNDRWGLQIDGEFAVLGDNDRDYGVNGLLLYKISKLNNLWMGYRYMNIGNDTDGDAGTVSVDFSQHGPTLGWAFTF